MPQLSLNRIHPPQSPLIAHASPAIVARCCVATTPPTSTNRFATLSRPSISVGALFGGRDVSAVTCVGGNSSRRRERLSMVIRCMANPRRVKMVAKQIMRELSNMLLTDKVLQYAVLPEASLGADRYLSSLTTISDVEISKDLQVVKVYVSVFGDERGKEVAMSGLKSKTKYVRNELGRRMKLRLTPEIRFIEDESIERGSRVLAILDRIKSENEKKNAGDQDDDDDERKPSDQIDDDWESDEDLEEDDDDDEGIIYVK